MDMQTPDGQTHVKLGPVEKWIVGIGAAVIVWVGYSTANKLNELSTQMTKVEGKVDLVTMQTNDIATMRSDVLTLKLQMESVKKDQETINRKFTP